MNDDWWKRYQLPEDFPLGRFPGWWVYRDELTEQKSMLVNLKFMMNFQYDRLIPPGLYTRLITMNPNEEDPDGIVMSDTPAEILDLKPLLMRVRLWHKPTVVMHGLGLGIAMNGVLMDGASKVTVVEKDEEIIKWVGAYWQKKYGDRIELIHDDAFTWRPEKGRKWDIAWHDIWPTVNDLNLPEMHTLHRRFGSRVKWQASWCRERCEWMREQLRKAKQGEGAFMAGIVLTGGLDDFAT